MSTRPIKPFCTAGAFDPTRNVYVKRRADDQLRAYLRDCVSCNLHATHQAGKTTLVFMVRAELSDEGHWCVYVDLALLFDKKTLNRGLRLLYNAIDEQLAALAQRPVVPMLHDPLNIEAFVACLMERVLDLLPADQRLYLMWDELDILWKAHSQDLTEFFLRLRQFFQDPANHQHRIVLLLISVVTPIELTASWNMAGVTPNSFAEIRLPPFTNDRTVREQIRRQAFPHFENTAINAALREILALTGGHPYLTALMGKELQEAGNVASLASITKDIRRANGIARNHYQAMGLKFFMTPTLLYRRTDTYKRIWRGEKFGLGHGNDDLTWLEYVGLISLGKYGGYVIANPLYRERFNENWVHALETERATKGQHKEFDSAASGEHLFDKRVLLIMCGGTVGMVTRQGRSDYQGADDLLQRFITDELTGIAPVETISLFQRDGINMTPAAWRVVADLINHSWDDFDGFVVTQGTDTLAFTASAVAFMLGPVSKPVVFTGAQTSINIPHGDARANLFRACHAAANPNAVPEVQVVFGDLVLRAVRTEKRDDRLFDGFHSPAWPPLARISETFLPYKSAWLPGIEKRPATPCYKPDLATRLLYIPLVPGLRPEYFISILRSSHGNSKRTQASSGGRAQKRLPNLERLDGVIITTPGLGNIPSEDPYNFRPFIQEAVKKGVPVLISSQMPINPYTQGQYEMASEPTRYGAIPAGNLTPASAFAKFAWVIGQVNLDTQANDERMAKIKLMMRDDYVGEEGDFG